ncbi:hypothetical protein RHRU231_860037 [Rhodococcus ruber]|uniref:Uncharacterized protein n=1 Tax=Rhodococcus ruber TaxID=1830 RepID=A0A098BVA7_9NOCA|nr:hypothetical protein RHRU231_860037 [Rhodococcus ruber]
MSPVAVVDEVFGTGVLPAVVAVTGAGDDAGTPVVGAGPGGVSPHEVTSPSERATAARVFDALSRTLSNLTPSSSRSRSRGPHWR